MADRILIVDDELDMLFLLKMILTEKTTFEVVTTPNPLEVEHLFGEQPFQLVIADLVMPGMEGMELIEVIKKMDPTVPVIIITAYGSIESAVEATQKGAFDYITKPFRKDRILLSLEKALEYRRNLINHLHVIEKGKSEIWPPSNLFNLPYAQAKEIVLDRFQQDYFQILFSRYPGDIDTAAEVSGCSQEELKRFSLKERGRE